MNSSVTSMVVPHLYLSDVAAAITFYKKAFGATERWRVDNPNGGTHVAELDLQQVRIRLHEQTMHNQALSPATLKATTVIIDLLVNDADALFARVIAAGAQEVSPMQTFEYGYRQGTIKDPFGHQWCIEHLDDPDKKPMMG
jgi:PhnB protein